MKYQTYTKLELAESQLNLAITFYLKGEEYPSIITLAGAAEEILGKIALEKHGENSLKNKLTELLSMHGAIWNEEAKESDYAQIQNKARNELKHLCSGEELKIDYERSSAKLLKRAIDNYYLCTGKTHSKQIEFNKERIRNWRVKYSAC